MSTTELFAKSVTELYDINALIQDKPQIQEIRNRVKEGHIYILKNAADADVLEGIKESMSQIGRGSIPTYHPIELGCPNHHRINYSDPRSYVKGCFHQFSFFPWNQDVYDLFNVFRPIYQVKNLINNIEQDKFMGMKPEDGCIARLAFQFYPSGLGYLNRHADPVDHHQLVVPTLTMSKKGVDFQTGGAYVIDTNGEKIYTDDISAPGDVVLFNALIHHGVEMIDEGTKPDWLSFRGRWMLLFATNKLGSNTQIANAVDLESKS